MRLRFAHFLPLLAMPLAAFAAQPLLLQSSDWNDAPALVRRAKVALAEPIVRVIDKPAPSPTGDPHDYVSYSRYWWPDPAKPDGLPYVRHDGHHNMEQVGKGDIDRFEKFSETVEVLAVAWARTGNEACAVRAGDWVRAWMIDPETRMNPSLDYSQVRLGHDDNHGSKSGVLDGRHLVRVVDALRLLENSKALSAEEDVAARAWLNDYYTWLTTSDLGRGEAKSPNNHGTWYVVQALTLARHLGFESDVRQLCEHGRRLIESQILPDGHQPLELARADGLSYSTFNLEAHLQVALLAMPVGIDLWNFVPKGGGGLKQAIEFVRPCNAAPETWPHNQLKKEKPGFLDPVLAMAKRLDSLGTSE